MKLPRNSDTNGMGLEDGETSDEYEQDPLPSQEQCFRSALDYLESGEIATAQVWATLATVSQSPTVSTILNVNEEEEDFRP